VAVVAAVVAVVAIGAAGVFAVVRSGADDGGAASPQALGDEVLAAIESEDVLGLVDVLLPSEREVFRGPLIELVDELTRLEVLGSDVDLSGISGIDLELADESVVVRDTNVADIANLRLRATASVTVDGETLPIGDLVLDNAPELDRSQLDQTETDEFDLSVTGVEADGRWYLSIFYTIAEAARQSASGPPDIPEVGLVAAGADTPEAALDAVFEGIESFDLERLITILNPGEAAALQRYAPLFLDEATAALDDVPFTWEVVDTQYDVTGDGDRRDAAVVRLEIEGEVEGEAFGLVLDGNCLTVVAGGEEFDSCELSGDLPGGGDLLPDSGPFRDMVAELQEVFADYVQPGISLVRTDGEWYVSPIGTTFEQTLAVLRALDRDELDTLIEVVPAAFDDLLFGSATIGDDLLDDPFGEDPFGEDPSDEDLSDEDLSDEDLFEDDLFDDGAAEGDGVDECWSLTDVDEAIACFQEHIESGETEPWVVPTELRFPECGMAEPYWNGYGQLGDAEFFALVDAARPCFLALLESGAIDDLDVPPEYTHPECFEGRNWYGVFDDPDYDERFDECVSS
jgi:hypothetical protein